MGQSHDIHVHNQMEVPFSLLPTLFASCQINIINLRKKTKTSCVLIVGFLSLVTDADVKSIVFTRNKTVACFKQI